MQHRAHRPPPPAATGETTPTAEDTLRNELAARGWEVRDGKEGQKVKKL